jgi:hypothetical protein
MNLPLMTEMIRSNRFESDHLLAATITLPPGETRDFVTALADCFVPKQTLDICRLSDDIRDDLQNDEVFVYDTIQCNPALVAKGLEDDAWAQKVIEKLPRLNRALIKNYITVLENKKQ